MILDRQRCHRAAIAANEANVETTGNTARVTRSSGLKLTWNPCMNDGDVVVQENHE